MSQRCFILFGAGGHGKVALDAVLACSREVLAVIDDQPLIPDLWGVPVLSAKEFAWSEWPNFEFLVSIGSNKVRERIFNELLSLNGRPANVVHPTAHLSSRAKIGQGVLLCAGAVVNPGASIGDNTIINTAATVDHDCQVGAHAHIAPGVHLAGNVGVGDRSLIGIGAVLLPGVQVGKDSLVGAGSVVNRDIPSNVVAFGAPARITVR